MPERTVNPRDSVDLVLLLQSYGETLGTLYIRAHVYDDADAEITGSPFTLSHVANNLYTKKNAFQVADSGTYKVVYLIYTDSGYTTRSSNHGEVNDVINVKIQSTTGLGGYGSMKNRGDVIVDFDPITAIIKKLEKRFDKKFSEMKKKFDSGLKVDVGEQDFKELYNKFEIVEKAVLKSAEKGDIGITINGLKSSQKANFDKILSAIKKNRSTTIKNKFDKAMMKPILQTVANSDLKIVKGFRDLEINIAKTIDMKNEEANKMFNETLDSALDKFLIAINALNESVRKKLKYTLEGLRTLLFVGKRSKQDINITLKKDEL